MAGIYSGIQLKLKNSKISLGDKLKLAHFAWISHQCFIPNKEQFLLDWVSQTLVGFRTKKQNLEEDAEQKLWIFLDNILHSRRLQSLIEEGKSLKLRFAIAQIMNDVIAIAPTQSHPSAAIGTVLNCCQGVLSTPCLGMVYKAKCELLVDLLSKLCVLACHCLTSELAITHKVLSVLNISLKQYTLLQRQQSNPNRLFTQVLTQLLVPSLLLRNALSKHVFDKTSNGGIHQLIKAIGSHLEVVLRTGLFQAELLTFYREELLSELETSEKKRGPLKGGLTPVCSTAAKLENVEFCDKESQRSFLANSVPFLYKLFLDSYCRDGNEGLCFQMLVKLFGCLCAPLTVKQDDLKVLFPGWANGIGALESMLSLALSHNIYNIAEDIIRGHSSQYKFYRSLIGILVCDPCRPSLPWFRCLKTLTLLNHLIVDPDLADILRACFADISDVHIRKAQETLLVGLLKTYTKLRQFPKLFHGILAVTCQSAAGRFSSGLSEKVSEFLVQLPPNQVLQMWATVLENCQLLRLEDDPSLGLRLEHLGSLLHCLMLHMKSLDSNTPVPVIRHFQHLMKQTAEELISPSLAIVRNHTVEAAGTLSLQKLSKVVLVLLHTWIEVNTVTALNCDKFVSPLRKLDHPLDSALECWDLSLFFEDKECWRKLHSFCKQSYPVGLFYLGLLSVQKMKLLLLHIDSPTEYEELALQASASFFVHSSVALGSRDDQQPFSGEVNTVTASCLPAARWHFIASNIKILLPYLHLKDAIAITDFLLETLLPSNNGSKQLDDNDATGLKNISESLLHSDCFSEMCVLQSIFLSSIFKKCALLVREQTALSELLALLSFNDTDWHEYIISVHYKGAKIVNPRPMDHCDDSVFLTNLKNVLRLVSSVPKETECVRFTKPDLLVNVIELISVLKPDSLPPSDLCRCFLVLLSFASAGSRDGLRLAGVCYRSMTYLLGSANGNYLFRIAYASDILEVVMTCIQSADWTVGEDDEQDWLKFLDIINLFFDSFLSLVMKRKPSVVINLEKITSFVLNSISHTEKTFWSTCGGQLHIVILKNLCHHLTLAVQEQNLSEEQNEGLNCLLKETAIKLDAVIQQCSEVAASRLFLPSILVTSATMLLEAERDGEGPLRSAELYRVFFSQILKEICYAKEHDAFLRSALRYLTACIAVKGVYAEHRGPAASVFTTVGDLLASPWFSNQILKTAEVELQRLLQAVTERCTCQEFHTLLRYVFNKLEVCNLWRKSYKVLFAGITMVRLLLNCSLEEDKTALFWSSGSQMISALVTVSVEACKERLPPSAVVVPVLDTMALFLRRGESYLSNPHHVTLSLSALLLVPLDHVSSEDYYSGVLALHEVLFSILQCHPKVMLRSVPTFLNCFHRLVASVMREGQQKGDKGASCVLKCARLVERMYTHIAAKTEDFTVFSSFMVSQFIHELQKVTLLPEVKKHLTEGIFHILDLCIDRDIKFLNASLQIGAREVFKELYHDYSSHYKTSNREEEKYTV